MKVNTSLSIIQFYGITKDPETNNFMMVMDYLEDGSLRQSLNKNFNSINSWDKLNILRTIANGLSHIHAKKLIHQDFHSGNILLSNIFYDSYITDLGLC